MKRLVQVRIKGTQGDHDLVCYCVDSKAFVALIVKTTSRRFYDNAWVSLDPDFWPGVEERTVADLVEL